MLISARSYSRAEAALGAGGLAPAAVGAAAVAVRQAASAKMARVRRQDGIAPTTGRQG